MRVTRHDSCWVSPFGHPRITARLPTPQGLSQAPTSFFGSRCQGIHHAPFIACLTNQRNNYYKRCSRPLSRSQTTTPHHPQPPHTGARTWPGTKTTQPPTTTRTQRSGVLMSQNPNSVPPTPPHQAPAPPTQEQHQHPGTCVHGNRVVGAPKKGGDPAAPSGTATLLRLSPNRQSHLRRLPPTRG